MELFLYFKTLIFFILLFICGIVIIRRLSEENKAEIIIPSGSIFGIALYIFIINLVAHFFKGNIGFYLSLLIEICIAVLLKRYCTVKHIEFPKGTRRILIIILLLFWIAFLSKIVSTNVLSGDVTYYYSLASLFSRGDYPMHAPWQPDYVMTYHYGGSEFLGATRSITGASYTFIHLSLAFFMLLAWSQILTWTLVKDFSLKLSSLLIILIPAFIGLISLGEFIIGWPAAGSTINIGSNIFGWLSQLPTLDSYGYYGAPTTLDMTIVFIHRFLSISFFFSLICILLLPRKQNLLLLSGGLIILLSSIALSDESVLIAIMPAVFLISFFTIFNRSVVKMLLFTTTSILLILLQGGLITESLFNRQGNSLILLFPQGIRKLSALSFHLFNNLPKYQPFRWLNPGISISLLLLFITTLLRMPKYIKYLLWLFLISALTSLFAYYGIVPKVLAENGSRFIILAYYFSGIGLSFFLIYWWLSSQRKLLILRIMIVWILLFSLLPPLFALFPRSNNANLMRPVGPEISRSFAWIRDNLSVNERIIVFNQPSVIIIANIGLAEQVGALTPMWDLTPRVENVFEMSPMYADAYFTLNPDTMRTLKIRYLIVSNAYLSQVTDQRKSDLFNQRYFIPVFIDSTKNETILKITPEYLAEGKNINGTLTELEQIAPKKGTYYIEYVPNMSENMFRALRVLLYNRDVYHPIGAAFYNGSINVEITNHEALIDNYDYLVLSSKTDPATICHCKAKLLWNGFGNDIKLWQTNAATD